MSGWRWKLGLGAALGLGAIYHLAPWPLPQQAVHAALVLGLAPAFRSPWIAVLWACGAGWLLEGSLHLYPTLGGTPLANMLLAVLAYLLRLQWPPESRPAYWGRLAVLTLLHLLLTHAIVRLVAGPHAWGWGWLVSLVTIPLWGTLSLWALRPAPRK